MVLTFRTYNFDLTSDPEYIQRKNEGIISTLCVQMGIIIIIY